MLHELSVFLSILGHVLFPMYLLQQLLYFIIGQSLPLLLVLLMQIPCTVHVVTHMQIACADTCVAWAACVVAFSTTVGVKKSFRFAPFRSYNFMF